MVNTYCSIITRISSKYNASKEEIESNNGDLRCI